MMNKLTRAVVAAIVVLLFVTGCSDDNEKFIQGAWYYRDAHLDSVPGETFLEIEWLFDQGTFEMHSCCFNGDFFLERTLSHSRKQGQCADAQAVQRAGYGSGRVR